MSRTLAILVCSLVFICPAFAQRSVFPDNTPPEQNGGLMIIRQGNQTTWSLGGVLFSRHVKTVTRTPEGKDIARFKLPSPLHSPTTPLLPDSAPASLLIEVPDKYALIFVEGELVRTHGTSRQLESPSLSSGKGYPMRLRAAYVVGEKFHIEDKELVLRAGETTAVTFDGSQALIVPLQRDDVRPAALR